MFSTWWRAPASTKPDPTFSSAISFHDKFLQEQDINPAVVHNMLDRKASADIKENIPAYDAKFEDFEVFEKLGEGQFGKVFKCRRTSTGQLFAMKCMEANNDKQIQIAYREENSLLRARGHPNVSSLECAFSDEVWRYVILEFCDLGSLRRYLDTVWEERKRRSQNREASPGLEPIVAQKIGLDILDGLGHLHSLSILHRDVKPENVGICSGPVAKLIDFGFAKTVVESINTVVGSDGYAAPEILKARRRGGRFNGIQDPTMDLYSFGILLFTTLVGAEARKDIALASGKISRTPWTHEDVQAMLEMPDAELWFCSFYEDEMNIFGHEKWCEMNDNGAIETIKRLTAYEARERIATTADAKTLPFFEFAARERVPAKVEAQTELFFDA